MGNRSKLIDWEQLDMIADGYMPDFVQIYMEFIDQTPELLDALDQRISLDDLDGAREAAHKIRGSSANFGFVGVSHPLAEFEQQVKEKGTLAGAVNRLSGVRENFAKSCAEVSEKRGI